MKGPGQRIDLDVRRIWKCPQCGKTQKFGGEITSARCSCSREVVWMQLVEENSPKHPEPVDESPAPQTLPPAEQPSTPEEKSAVVGDATEPVEEIREESTPEDPPTPPPDEQL